jgi:hypothetical protein
MKDIIPLFRDQLDGEERAFYQEIWNLLDESYSYVDLESVFSVVDKISTGYSLNDLGPVATFHCRKYSQLRTPAKESRPLEEDVALALHIREKFRKFIREQFQVRHDMLGKIEDVFTAFFNVLSKHAGPYIGSHKSGRLSYLDWPMFTTNYDLNVETFFELHDVDLVTGATQKRNYMILDTSKLFPILPEKPNLVKLHGSLNWIKVGDEIRIESLPSDARYTWDGKEALGEVVLYPIAGKELYRYPFLELFQHLRRQLTLTDTWVVVGYRFNDEVIRNMFLDSFSLRKRLILIHPRPEMILDTHLAAIRDGVKAVKAEFGNVEMLTEQLETTLTQAT